MKHKRNLIVFSKLFGGGEADVHLVVAHNVHKNIGRIQEGGMSMIVFGPLIEYGDMSEGDKDTTGLGLWVVMTVKGGNRMVMRIGCKLNPCRNDKLESGTVYQQHRRFFMNKENSLQSLRVRFREDLIEKLMKWRKKGIK